MKILYYGGQKSGKTRLATEKILKLKGEKKPIYIATYIDNFDDREMQLRIQRHKEDRGKIFRTIEEGIYLSQAIESDGFYLIDCLSMWILNSMERGETWMIEELEKIFLKNTTIIFILNDTSRGVIPFGGISRNYIDLCGIIGQYVAQKCDAVYSVEIGIERKLK